jgi:hypothetical protein
VKDERAYLLHAIEAIDAIFRYTVDGSEAFFSDGKTQGAVIRNIEIIGQAGSPVCATSSSTNTSRSASSSPASQSGVHTHVWSGSIRSSEGLRSRPHTVGQEPNWLK